MKKGQFIVPNDNRRLHVEYSDYVVYSYDKENFTFEFLFPDYPNIHGEALLILKGDKFARQQYSLDVIDQKAKFVVPESILGYEGSVKGYLYLAENDIVSNDDAFMFTFLMRRSEIDSDLLEISNVYYKKFEDLIEELKIYTSSVKSQMEDMLRGYTLFIEEKKDKVSNIDVTLTEMVQDKISDLEHFYSICKATMQEEVHRVSDKSIVAYAEIESMLDRVSSESREVINEMYDILLKVRFEARVVTSEMSKKVKEFDDILINANKDINKLKTDFNTFFTKAKTDVTDLNTQHEDIIADIAQKAATLETTYAPRLTGIETEVSLARHGAQTLGERLDESEAEIAEVTTQLAQTATKISTKLVNASALGLIPDVNTSEAASTNTTILNDVLNNNSKVMIEGTYYVNDITVNNAGLELSGDFQLYNHSCLNHIIKFVGKIHHSGSMYVNGLSQHIDGVVFENIGASVLGKITARLCRNHGVFVVPSGNSNSVVANYIRTEANGVIHVSDLKVIGKTGAIYTQATKLEISTPIPTSAFRLDNITGIIVGGVFYEVVAASIETEKQTITVRPNLPHDVGSSVVGAEVLVGGGLYFGVHNDTNWWNVINYVGTDYTVSLFDNCLYGHKFNNMLLEGPRVGVITGTRGLALSSIFEHPYIEGNVTFPFVVYRGTTTIIEPLTDTFKIHHLWGEDLDVSNITIISKGKILEGSRNKKPLSTSSSSKDLFSGDTLVLDKSSQAVAQQINLKVDKIGGKTVNNVATLIYLNDYAPAGSWNKDVVFVPESGYTVNNSTSYTFTSVATEKYVFYAFLIGTNWTVLRIKAE